MGVTHWYYHLSGVVYSETVAQYMAECREQHRLMQKLVQSRANLDKLRERIERYVSERWSFQEVEEAKKSFYSGKEVPVPQRPDDNVPF